MRWLPLLLIGTPVSAMPQDYTPPPPTETTTECQNGQVWDPEAETCRDSENAAFDDAARLRAARELAQAERYDDALRVLGTIRDQEDTDVLTITGFAHRKAGRMALGLEFYDRALAADPDNLLARAYLGEAYLEAGDAAAARAQLSEIRRRGGRQTWPEIALRLALETGQRSSY
ncbi:MAG: tetratricopeptide repeat protein [Pseudomonadota bacterium]